MKLALVVNPLAGIGGRVALKGSDGAGIVQQALQRGAVPLAPARVRDALGQLRPKPQQAVLTAAGRMGEDSLAAAGLEAEAVYTPSSAATTAQDTRAAVHAFCDRGFDLLLFAGGDGTARDVLDALGERGMENAVPVIGIPAGCKIHSAVYAITPQQAGDLARAIAAGEVRPLRQAEVMDLDEEAFRHGIVKARCYGYLLVPADDEHMQTMKEGAIQDEQLVISDIAAFVAEQMQPETLYLVGSGSTTAAVMAALGLEGTLLGIDAVMDGQLVGSDLDERRILELLAQKTGSAQIILTVIGGQGHVFGRGNQQLSPQVIRQVGRENLVIIAGPEKLRSLQRQPLHADTGDAELDAQLAGPIPVITGYDERVLYPLQ
jgi:predicted polyphosphate/ATP-dependent NAD kinase